MSKYKDMSVTLQGSVDQTDTPKCINSIRKWLPGAEIILSTWEGSDISGLDYDILVLNKDPGAVLMKEHLPKKKYLNVDRQIVSTQNGLKKATRKYALKIRSDLVLTTDNFLKYFDEYQARGENYNLFERKILVPMIFTRFSTQKDNPNG